MRHLPGGVDGGPAGGPGEPLLRGQTPAGDGGRLAERLRSSCRLPPDTPPSSKVVTGARGSTAESTGCSRASWAKQGILLRSGRTTRRPARPSLREIAEQAEGRVIAERIGRDPSVVCREIPRHGGRGDGLARTSELLDCYSRTLVRVCWEAT